MWFVITVMLTVTNGEQASREYKAKTFSDTWTCHEYIGNFKVELITPHLEAYAPELRGFEFYCESRHGTEV